MKPKESYGALPKEASKVMALINQHRTTLGDALQKNRRPAQSLIKPRNIRVKIINHLLWICPVYVTDSKDISFALGGMNMREKLNPR